MLRIELLPKEKVEPLLDEANQLTAIMVASRKTATENQQANKPIFNLQSSIQNA